MSRRWGDTTAFRAERVAAPAARASLRQSVALLAVLALVVGAIAAASYLITPERAHTFDLLHGSVFLADSSGPVAVDLPSGRPTLRLINVDKQVGGGSPADLRVIPAAGATVLLDRATGEFNMVRATGFVVKHDGGGVVLPGPRLHTTSDAFPTDDPDDPGQAYIVRSGASRTDVFLVDRTTVEEATGDRRPAPQASAQLAFAARAESGGAVSAGGNLWLMEARPAATGGGYRLHELRAPADRAGGGALLSDVRRGSVTGAVALAATTADAASTGTADTVAMATAGRIDIFHADGTTTHLAVQDQQAPDTILAATSAAGSFVFLLHDGAGWSIESVRADGTGLRNPLPLPDVPRRALLAVPAISSGAAFTLDKATGVIYRIGLDSTVRVVARYRTVTAAGSGAGAVTIGEPATFDDGYLVSRGSRVLVDSASHVYEIAIRTDGRPPFAVPFLKTAAIKVNAAGDPDALTRTNLRVTKTGAPSTGHNVPKNVGINTNTECDPAHQKLHAAVLTATHTGSRTVDLSWTYPTLGRQDCLPTSYRVYVERVSGDAPAPAPYADVSHSTEYTVPDLYPDSRYRVGVAAVVNHIAGPPSQWSYVDTQPEGPAAPSAPTVVPDAAGNWTLSWQGCGSVAAGCAPVSSWIITPSVCDNHGGITNPQPMPAPADPSARRQPPAVYSGGDALLGRGLRFTVSGQGTGAAGEGAPSAPSACTYSSGEAKLGALTLTPTKTVSVPFGHSAQATVSLDLGDNPTRDVGGIGAQITIVLTGGGDTQQQTVIFDGTQSTVTVTFTGLRPGQPYRASATVTPPGSVSSVTVQKPLTTVRSEWPAVTMGAQCVPTSAVACTLQVSIGGISSASSDGEYFDFAGTLTCGAVTTGLSRTAFDPADTAANPISTDVSQLNAFYGACSVSGSLQESAGTTQLFGGVVSPLGPVGVDLRAPAVGGAGPGDFAATFVDQTATGGGAAVEIAYQGTNPVLGLVTANWTETVYPQGQADCSSPAGAVTPGGDAASAAYVGVSNFCVAHYGDQDRAWIAHIEYDDVVTHDHQAFDIPFTGRPTGYQACAPDGFVASWDPVTPGTATVTLPVTAPQIGGCSNVSYSLVTGDGTTCATSSNIDPTMPQALHCDTPPAPTDGGWTVHITWHNDDTDLDQAAPDLPLGLPPP